MALNYYFGYDENGRVGRRTTGLRPPFGGNNRLMFITHRTPKYTECDEVQHGNPRRVLMDTVAHERWDL